VEHPWDRRLGVWWIAEDHPDLPAILESPSGTRTFAELVGSAHQIVHALRSLGVEPGAAVAAMLPNGVDVVECSLACQEAGWYFVPLNTFLTAGEVARIVAHSGAQVLIVHQQFASVVTDPVLDEARDGVAVLTVGAVAGVDSLDGLRERYPTSEPANRSPGSLFTYTSGTTGQPKGIRRPVPPGTPGEVANTSAVFGRAFQFRPLEGCHLVSTAMFHGGAHSFYMGALNVGQPLVIMARFDPEETLRLIEAYRVTTAYMVPTQFHRLLRLPVETRGRYDTSSLQTVVHSAAPCPRDVKQRMLEWWGPVIWETYGGMEAPATIAKPWRWLERPGTVGRAIRGVQLAVLDDDGKTLPPGEAGMVFMATQKPAFEYHGDAEGTRGAFRGNRFTLGDVGYLDEDGYLFIVDRAKDMIITGGVNVYPQEVEAVLLAHPSVADVAVIGVPDDDWGEQVKAVVQLGPRVSATDDLSSDLVRYCRERLAAYKCPRSVDFRDDLPRTDAGKLYKRQIRDQYWVAMDRAL
jgi:long-chain acyl-CoA synthetase